MKIYISLMYLGLFFLSFAGLSLSANEPHVYDAWQVRTSPKDKNKVFYITSLPESQTGNFKKRGQTYISITARPAQKSFNVFSLKAGYAYKEGSAVKISIFSKDKKKLNEFELFTQEEMAWAVDDKMDKELIQTMKKGDILIAEGISHKGTLSTDTYALKGFTVALHELESLTKKS